MCRVISCEPDLFPSAEPWPDGVAIRAQNAELLAGFVAQLTGPQQRLVFLHHDCDTCMENIAAEMGISPAAAYRLHDRAIAALRRQFEMRRICRYADVA
jgi:DNA-directed RNA polymerase specialized sigma24 family protein